MCMCECVYVCICMCVSVYVFVHVRACVRACVCVSERMYSQHTESMWYLKSTAVFFYLFSFIRISMLLLTTVPSMNRPKATVHPLTISSLLISISSLAVADQLIPLEHVTFILIQKCIKASYRAARLVWSAESCSVIH